jgi:hypothetical protein
VQAHQAAPVLPRCLILAPVCGPLLVGCGAVHGLAEVLLTIQFHFQPALFLALLARAEHQAESKAPQVPLSTLASVKMCRTPRTSRSSSAAVAA